MSEIQMPDYRVRLFLSVDLTGSTAFKAKKSSFDWLKEFQKFYASFPDLYSTNYERICSDINGLVNAEKLNTPKVWKTIGDEILFVNRVNSIIQLGAYITAFADTLKEYGSSVQAHNLNTKGNGWVAAFPSPNCSIGIGGRDVDDPIAGVDDLPTEEFEANVDAHPRRYEFLGKGIDGGFRISQNSSIDTFTISPALALLLSKARTNPDATKFEAKFRFHEPQSLKGVLNGQRYPIVSIDTQRDETEIKLSQLEARLLKKPSYADEKVLREYLECYIENNDIEMPSLRLSDQEENVNPPQHYNEYAEHWRADYLQKKIDEDSLMQDSVSTDEDDLTALEGPKEFIAEIFRNEPDQSDSD